MQAEPQDVATLPPFSNQRGCPQCGARYEIRVHFNRDCARVRGDHFHRVCRCPERGNPSRRPPIQRRKYDPSGADPAGLSRAVVRRGAYLTAPARLPTRVGA